jgi:hypothetical protein
MSWMQYIIAVSINTIQYNEAGQEVRPACMLLLIWSSLTLKEYNESLEEKG